MAKKKPLSHYVPKFSNKYWADDANFMSYLSSETSSTVTKLSQGKKQWGRKGGLYSWDVEKALDNGLETKVAPVYEKIVSYSEITESERLLWSQFLLSQLVRTPSYMEYEKTGAEIAGIRHAPKHDRVGCLDCLDLNFIANRNWLLLIVNEDDYLVRTDNPVFQSGFIELHDSYLIYPLTPTLCFVATPMDELWNPLKKNKNPTMGFEMAKGQAHMVNFYLARGARCSLILSPKHDGAIAEHMFSQVLGVYTQPPFSLHITENGKVNEAYESIRIIMSTCDGVEYPDWNVEKLVPDYPYLGK